MSTDRIQTREACLLGLPDERLSALRDELLPADEAARVRAHAAGCAACGERLAGFDRVGAALRGQRLAGPSPRLWADVRFAIAERERSHVARGRAHPAWSGLGALAAALVIALLFALALRSALVGRGGPSTHLQPTATAAHRPTETATLAPTVTPLPPLRGTPPNWRQYSLPQGYYLSFPISTLTVAPSDGNIAYLCDGDSERASPQLARVLVTHDRGVHWTRESDVATGGACNSYFVVDQSNPSIVVAGSGQPTFLSVDGGASWQPLPQRAPAGGIEELTWSGSGAAYAIIGTLDQTSGVRIDLAVSTDGLQTWRNVDAGIAINGSTGDSLRQFWLNPSNGHLLVATQSNFWASTDGGQTWRRLAASGVDPEISAVQQPAGTADWHICSPSVCTTDGGRTWTALPQLLPLLSDGSNPGEFALAIASNGSLLAYTTSPNELYQLAPGGMRWEDLGPLPLIAQVDSYAAYAPAPGASGALWALPPGGKGAYSQYYSAPLPAGG